MLALNPMLRGMFYQVYYTELPGDFVSCERILVANSALESFKSTEG